MKEIEKKRKMKLLRIDVRNSVIEGNLVEIPFLYYTKEKDKPNLVRYEWKDSTDKEFSAEIEGSIKYGLPTPYELDVFLALLRIKARESEIYYGENAIAYKDIDESDLIVEFTFNQIAKELNKAPNGQNIARIKKAILTLTNTTITSTSESLLYDISKKTHVKNEELSVYRLIDSYNLKTKKSGQSNIDKNIVSIGKFFYYSIANSYFKYFDFEMYLELGKNGISKRLFLLLNKWKNNKTNLTVKLETLYERIPLPKEQPAYRKNELIKKATLALKKIGYLKDYQIKNEKITFNFASEKALEIESHKKLEKYTLPTQIIERLQEHGFTQQEIMNDYINTIMIKQEYVKAFLRYTDDEIDKKQIKDTKSYIIAGFINTYDIPQEYYNQYTK